MVHGNAAIFKKGNHVIRFHESKLIFRLHYIICVVAIIFKKKELVIRLNHILKEINYIKLF